MAIGELAKARTVLMDFIGPVVQEHGPRPALRWREGYRHRGITFDELGRAIHAAAHRLHAAGVRPDDPVLLFGPTSPDWAVAFFAVVVTGGVVVPLDETSRPEFVTQVARRTGTRFQIVHAGFPTVPGLQCAWRWSSFTPWRIFLRSHSSRPRASGTTSWRLSSRRGPRRSPRG